MGYGKREAGGGLPGDPGDGIWGDCREKIPVSCRFDAGGIGRGGACLR